MTLTAPLSSPPLDPRETYDLRSPAFRADPFTTYARMRCEAPIYSHEEDGPVIWNRGVVWHTFRYDHTVEILRDTRRFVKDYRLAFASEELAGMPEEPYFSQVANDGLISKENPRHAQLRRLITTVFTTAIVESRRPRMEAIADELIDRVETEGRMDLVGDFAFRIPVIVITEILGLPTADADSLRDMVNAANPETEEQLERSLVKTEELFDYLRGHFAARRQAPRDDLISALLQAEVDGEKLDDHDMLAMLTLLVGAGFETTLNLIGNGVRNLLAHPSELERLRLHPEIMDSAVEELLRYEGPLYVATPRWASEDIDFHGHPIRRGDRVFPVLLAANRDPERFEDPDRLDLARVNNRHVGFGMGNHFCLGAPLARLETKVALATLNRRLPNLRLDVAEDELRWRDNTFLRALEALPVAW